MTDRPDESIESNIVADIEIDPSTPLGRWYSFIVRRLKEDPHATREFEITAPDHVTLARLYMDLKKHLSIWGAGYFVSPKTRPAPVANGRKLYTMTICLEPKTGEV